uniref:6-phosphofructokinase n=1 Tax=Ndongobacter massiliensis TaxID=1871025 RepID=UPI000931805E|nr:ATP-dependent 6-phosphofructokinase [Ndongobacter massiliensis]
MALRVGVLTSGGDCQSLNATLRGFGKALYRFDENATILGFQQGYKGLMYNLFREMKFQEFSGLLSLGGTILGTSRQSFKTMRDPDEYGNDKVELMKETYRKNRLDALVVLGGNGSQKTANLLTEEGLCVVGLPKTIDNDLWGTDMTFGFHSALRIATDAIDCIHTTAASHGRVFIVEIMGHKVGWLTLAAGIAAGADVILIPEIPYSIDSVCETIRYRREHDNKFSIIAVAEGVKTREEAEMKKKDYKKLVEKRVHPSVAYEIAECVETKLGAEVRVTVPGHMQRGGSPNAFDRLLATRIGARGAQAIIEKDFGKLVVFRGDDLCTIPLSESAGRLKSVPVDHPWIQEARMIGIGFGD